MTFYQLFILSCFKKNQEMRSSTLYHLLKGKRTSSILSYGYFYDVLPYFALFPKLVESKYQLVIAECVSQGFLIEETPGYYFLTDQGEQQVKGCQFPNIDELKQLNYYKWDMLFFNRLMFTSQVISEKVHHNKSYIPIEGNLFKQQRLKIWLKHQNVDLEKNFYQEWLFISSLMTKEAQKMILGQLSGYEYRGLTLNQIAFESQQDMTYSYIQFKNYLHQMISSILTQKENTPLFYAILIEEITFTKEDSCVHSANLFYGGSTIEEVAYQRGLKVSTVTDHLIEDFILFPDSKKIPYFNPEKEQTLQKFYLKCPNIYRWTFKQALIFEPTLTFYEFKFYQFRLLKEEKND